MTSSVAPGSSTVTSSILAERLSAPPETVPDVWRASREPHGGALIAVKETGGAVVLCSLTTTLGYLALLSSMNFAVKSLGLAAVIGEITTLLAAMLVLPAALVWMERAGAKGRREIPAD